MSVQSAPSSQAPSERESDVLEGRRTGESSVVLVTLGTRGDVQPFCLLARELQRQGYVVRLVINNDYLPLARSFGLDPVVVNLGSFEDLFSHERAASFDQYSAGGRKIWTGWRQLRLVQARFAELLRDCLHAIQQADLVVYNALAFFAGELAHELGIPAVRMTCQPLLPSRLASLSLLGGRDRGPLLNRASYEIFRLVSATVLRGIFRTRLRSSGAGKRLRPGCNPLTLGLGDSHQLLAFSPALAPDPGDWPRPYTQTGFLLREPEPGERLPDEVESFLEAGPPPVYVGFGSMRMHAERNTRVVLDALALRGGRAILAKGAGSLRPPADLPPGVLVLGGVRHELLFPRVSCIVHHGGSGTVAAAGRSGRPSVVVPFLGDQLFWGRRLAAAGATEEPLGLGQMTPAKLADRIVRAETDSHYAAAAARLGTTLAREPGLAGAADLIRRLLATTSRRNAA
ncbi:sterol 3beta-glucosyltransferase [Methylobacterium sp. BE186]|uniref:glycosyltransferase n=1 Tax=Methylobacterium sp. BE186 TaxID=2817715 RepID=UPI00285ABF95|nr:glycosyltransferase [Methylobacterium sp. BE186]MDR7036063.1 sterol 3beta-glucosyltransferase [Methylobacterium sp. BE186]